MRGLGHDNVFQYFSAKHPKPNELFSGSVKCVVVKFNFKTLTFLGSNFFIIWYYSCKLHFHRYGNYGLLDFKRHSN